MIAPMSYGALSASTKRAVGLASTLSGIAENTGEGGMSDAQRGAASQLIFQMLGGRLGWNIHDMNRADGLEIYISQGAKLGLGGQLMAKCLGADAVAFGTSAIIAGGCIACMQCHIGQCVIATQDPEHEKRYDPQAESHNIHRFLEGVRWQIAALTHALGHTDFRALNRDDLVALTPEAAEITGLPHEPSSRAKTPELRVRLG